MHYLSVLGGSRTQYRDLWRASIIFLNFFLVFSQQGLASEIQDEDVERVIRYIHISPDHQSAVEETAYPSSAITSWHLTAQKALNQIDKVVNSKKDRSINLATFRITAIYEGGEERSAAFESYIFLSRGTLEGISKDTLSFLEREELQPKSMVDFFLSEEEPRDHAYRRHIIEFFDFREKLSLNDKQRITSYAKRHLKDIKIDKTLLRALETLYNKSLTMGGFDEESNTRAQTLLKHTADNLFDEFHHWFYHSEQVLRLFINHSARTQEDLKVKEAKDSLRKASALLSEQEGDYDILSAQARLQEAIQHLEDYKRQLLSLPWQQLLPEEGKRFEDLRGIRLDIATHRHMCEVCQGTYFYDVAVKKQLQHVVLYAMMKAHINRLKYGSPEEGNIYQEQIKEWEAKISQRQFPEVTVEALISGIREGRE